MIDLKGTMGIPFLKKSRFTGSDGMLRFVLEKRSGNTVPADGLWPEGKMQKRDETGTPEGDVLAAVCWHGPYCSDATPDEQKTTAYFPFSKEGLAQAQDWLNAQIG